MARRDDPPAWLRHLGNSVPTVHPERLAPLVQRPVLHVELTGRSFTRSSGFDWVNDNGPGGKRMEQGEPNGHEQEVAPLKRILLRNAPELEPELRHVINTFDPWARDRGEYYSLEWEARADARSDPSFKK